MELNVLSAALEELNRVYSSDASRRDELRPLHRVAADYQSAVEDLHVRMGRVQSALDDLRRSLERRGDVSSSCGVLQDSQQVELCAGKVEAFRSVLVNLLEAHGFLS